MLIKYEGVENKIFNVLSRNSLLCRHTRQGQNLKDDKNQSAGESANFFQGIYVM